MRIIAVVGYEYKLKGMEENQAPVPVLSSPVCIIEENFLNYSKNA